MKIIFIGILSFLLLWIFMTIIVFAIIGLKFGFIAWIFNLDINWKAIGIVSSVLGLLGSIIYRNK